MEVYEEKKSLKDRFEEFKSWVGRKKDAVVVWVNENRELVVIATPIVIGGAFDLVKALIKSNAAKEEQELHDDYIYDRSCGHYYKIKHIKSSRKRNREFLEIDRRRKLGESLGEILQERGLLK